MAGVTQAQAWFAKSIVFRSLIECPDVQTVAEWPRPLHWIACLAERPSDSSFAECLAMLQWEMLLHWFLPPPSLPPFFRSASLSLSLSLPPSPALCLPFFSLPVSLPFFSPSISFYLSFSLSLFFSQSLSLSLFLSISLFFSYTLSVLLSLSLSFSLYFEPHFTGHSHSAIYSSRNWQAGVKPHRPWSTSTGTTLSLPREQALNQIMLTFLVLCAHHCESVCEGFGVHARKMEPLVILAFFCFFFPNFIVLFASKLAIFPLRCCA